MRPSQDRWPPGRLAWLRSFLPMPLVGGRREMLLAGLGAALGLFGTEWLSRHWLGEASPWFIAPMGASAVLLFAVPASPLAQPWSILGGNLLSGLIGVGCYLVLGETGLAAGLAVGLAIVAMFALRCLHPPGGAVALTSVIGGPAVHDLGFSFVLWPVAVNSLLLLALALLVHSLTRRRYPHHAPTAPHPHRTQDPQPSARLGYTREDLDAALAATGELLDISRDDLAEILAQAELHANQRRWKSVRCQDIMSRDVVHVGPDEPLELAWQRLARHKVKALPVTTPDGALVGIVSIHDFFIDRDAPAVARMPTLRQARRVAEIMTRRVRMARPEQGIVELVGLFSDGGLHHMPVVDAERRVVGMLTQSDLVAALFKTSAPV